MQETTEYQSEVLKKIKPQRTQRTTVELFCETCALCGEKIFYRMYRLRS
jgi:hypothetical protein